MFYAVSEPMPVGRDVFEQVGFAHGFRLRRKPNMIKTTWGQRVEVYPNLIEGLVLTATGQVWQSDIFYIEIEGSHYYGVTIEDVYSRQLMALHLSTSLGAAQLIKAFKQALAVTKGADLTGCIFHSDRGSQYISHTHKQLLEQQGMKISMGKLPQENAYVERLQGTLKHEYLQELALTRHNVYWISRKIIGYYNGERPHSKLNMMTPHAFAIYQQKLRGKQRATVHIYRGFAIAEEPKNSSMNCGANSDQPWKSGKTDRQFSKEIFSTFPQLNSNNNLFKKQKNKNQKKTT